jgi:hypothetical protein
VPPISRAPRSKRLAALVCAAVSVAATAQGEPLRLRADALAQARAPAGLLVLQGEDHARPWIDAEALVWASGRDAATGDPAGDVLVLTVRVHEPRNRLELRGGRFVAASGAVRPVHLDGADALARAPWGTTAEAWAGAPVVPRFGPRSYDWVAGGRLGQTVLGRATAGLSYQQRRTAGELSSEEAGVDAAIAPAAWIDVAARGAWDLVDPGLAEALASAAVRGGGVRWEAFATRRSPSRLLPATSLFSVLGDLPATTVGTTVRWAAAPRLDLLATAAAQRVGEDAGGNASLRATLRLDDRGDASISLEGRRQAVSTARWSGVRVASSQPVVSRLFLASELELVVPDDATDGSVWPWGLVALAWRWRSGWEAAGALEARASREQRSETDALLRVGYRWEAP